MQEACQGGPGREISQLLLLDTMLDLMMLDHGIEVRKKNRSIRKPLF